MSLPNATKPLLLGSTAAAAYQVSRSLRFNSPDAAYLSRTPSVSSSTRTLWTYSGWVKLNLPITTYGHALLSSGTSSSNYVSVYIDSTAQLWVLMDGYYKYGGPLIRDASAWYHFVVAYNSNESAGSRIKMYSNGVQVTTTASSEITSNYSSPLGVNTNPMYVGRIGNNAGWTTFTNISANLAENIWIDGQALTPSSFAETNATTGQWVPKAYAGTYGTNGFKLNFSDNSAATAATLGADSSGNGNNFTPTNLSVTAGVGNDSLTDTPTQYGSDTGAGGEVRGNYGTFNPLNKPTNTVLANGNLQATNSVGAIENVRSTMPTASTYSYWEITASVVGSSLRMNLGGILSSYVQSVSNAAYLESTGPTGTFGAMWNTGFTFYVNGSSVYTNGTANLVANDVIMFAHDSSTGKVWVGLNGTFYNSGNPAAGTGNVGTLTADSVFPAVMVNGGAGANGVYINFGQRPFAYTAPSGFKALCTQNLPTPTIVLPSTAFDAKLYTGTGSSQSITGLGFNPDLVWIKSRSAATDNTLYDSVRGAQARLESNNTDAEVTADAGLTAFDATGFTVNTLAQVNTSAATYVGWCWDESVSAGFDIVTYTGTGAAQTINHNLGVTPKVLIVKNRTGLSRQWCMYHSGITSSQNGGIYLNLTNAWNSDSTLFNNTAPTSTQFTVGSYNSASSEASVAYLWAEVAGFSKFGSYTGNGIADGPFVHCGFRPRFVLIKHSSGAGNNWRIWDSSRFTSNENKTSIYPSLTNAESVEANGIDILSNGFKVRWSDGAINGSAATYVFMAFAENPFKYANAK